MPDLLIGPTYQELFDHASRSVWRLETRDGYAGDEPRLERWLAGELEELEYSGGRAAWLDRVRATTATGVAWGRVRVVAEPPTVYQRFALMAAAQNVQAGEDIRYLQRERANALELPDHDFWLLDDERLVVMHFSADDRMLGAQVVTEPAVVRQHARWREIASAEATPYARYLAENPTRALRPSSQA
jgi:hypothetical protein